MLLICRKTLTHGVTVSGRKVTSVHQRHVHFDSRAFPGVFSNNHDYPRVFQVYTIEAHPGITKCVSGQVYGPQVAHNRHCGSSYGSVAVLGLYEDGVLQSPADAGDCNSASSETWKRFQLPQKQ